MAARELATELALQKSRQRRGASDKKKKCDGSGEIGGRETRGDDISMFVALPTKAFAALRAAPSAPDNSNNSIITTWFTVQIQVIVESSSAKQQQPPSIPVTKYISSSSIKTERGGAFFGDKTKGDATRIGDKAVASKSVKMMVVACVTGIIGWPEEGRTSRARYEPWWFDRQFEDGGGGVRSSMGCTGEPESHRSQDRQRSMARRRRLTSKPAPLFASSVPSLSSSSSSPNSSILLNSSNLSSIYPPSNLSRSSSSNRWVAIKLVDLFPNVRGQQKRTEHLQQQLHEQNKFQKEYELQFSRSLREKQQMKMSRAGRGRDNLTVLYPLLRTTQAVVAVPSKLMSLPSSSRDGVSPLRTLRVDRPFSEAEAALLLGLGSLWA